MYDHKTMTKLSAPLALKKYIVQEANKIAYQGFHFDGPLNTEEEIERAYDYTIDKDNYGIKTEIKEWGFDTDLSTPLSRHYECDAKAIKTEDGWVGYNYWYGGGKHGAPESIDWISDAYYLNCEEKEVLTIQRTWSKV